MERRIAAGEFDEIDAPDVTVVIPVYENADYLEDALASVYEQTHTSWEIIVVDDGSMDPAAIAFLDTSSDPASEWCDRSTRVCPEPEMPG